MKSFLSVKRTTMEEKKDWALCDIGVSADLKHQSGAHLNIFEHQHKKKRGCGARKTTMR